MLGPVVSSGLLPQRAAPMNYFLHSGGPITARTMHLGWVFAVICALVCLVIAGLLAYAILHRRARNPGEPDGPAGARPRRSSSTGLQAVALGTAGSTLVLIGMAVYALVVLEQVARPAQPVGLNVTVTGYDWWWRVDYTDGDTTQRFTTANEIHVPAGVPVRMRLDSADVIHAFWVPMLAGKTQMIPGLTNEQWLQADQPGRYRGQCTQYCGVQHAHMAVEVIAEPPAQFAAWQAAQRLPATTDAARAYAAATAATSAAAGNARDAGARLFAQRCAGCHAVRGTAAAGVNGPDLTHLNARRTIAAGLLTNTPAHLLQWITATQDYKPGTRMPSMALTAGDRVAMGAFLATLN